MFANAKATKTRFFAVFAVMMLMLCSVAVIADADASPYGGVIDNSDGDTKNQKYTVELSVGQTFTYSNIATNLDSYGSIVYTWASGEGNSACNAIRLDETNKVLTGSFSSSGTYSGILTATWTGPTGTDKVAPTQTATQAFTFQVDEKLVIADGETPSVTAYALVGWNNSKQVLEISYSGSTSVTKDQDSEVVGMSCTYGSDKHKNNDTDFEASHTPATSNTKGKITINPNAELTDKDTTSTKSGPQQINVTLTNPNTNDTASIEILLYIYDKIAITSETTHYYTYEGDTKYTTNGFVFKVNYDDDNDDKTVTTDYSYTLSPTTQGVLTVNPDATDATAKKTVGISTNFEKSGDLVDQDTISKNYTATLAVTGNVNSDDALISTSESIAAATFTLTVYKSLEFTSAPEITKTLTKAAGTGSNNTMSLSSYIAGAKYITINWGDGRFSEKTDVSTETLYNAQHTYNHAGMYLITITAENDVGTTTSKVMYSVNSNSDATSDDTKKDSKGFFEQHGYLFLVFVLIVIGLLVAFFFFGIQHPAVLLAAIVCAILAVALYFYGDFSGIVDAIKGGK